MGCSRGAVYKVLGQQRFGMTAPVVSASAGDAHPDNEVLVAQTNMNVAMRAALLADQMARVRAGDVRHGRTRRGSSSALHCPKDRTRRD